MKGCSSRNGVPYGVALLALVVGSMSGFAETIPTKGKLDARVRNVRYEPGQVYRITAFVGYHVHLQFESGESLVGLGAGDIEGLAFVAQGSHLFLKPKAPRVTTNLTVVTDRRHYLFEYSAEARRPNPALDEVIYSLVFEYAPPAASRDPVERVLAQAPKPTNTDYGYCGDRALKPLAAFDDGMQLHLRFAPRADWPAVFAINADGTESLVNFTVERDELIVHRLAERYVLRRGRATGCVVNRAYARVAPTPRTETRSPDVARRALGSAP